MPSLRFATGAAACVIALTCPATAAALPPANDNYLASTTIVSSNGTMPREYQDAVDTSEATTQPDMFNPNKEGQPLGGGDPEPTQCGPSPFGKTVWYDFKPPTWGGVEIVASGFDTVVAVHQWSESSSRITRTVLCQNDKTGPTEDVLLPQVTKGTNYTVQVGGANAVGGPLDFELNYFPDRDHDGEFDELDDCPSQAGTRGGCPPELRSAPRITHAGAPAITITRLAVDAVPKGGRVEVRCGNCGRKVTRKARKSGTLRIPGFVGRVLQPGDKIEVRITLRKRGSGKFRFGAVGKYIRWPVEEGALGRSVRRCLEPGSRKPTKCG